MAQPFRVELNLLPLSQSPDFTSSRRWRIGLTLATTILTLTVAACEEQKNVDSVIRKFVHTPIPTIPTLTPEPTEVALVPTPAPREVLTPTPTIESLVDISNENRLSILNYFVADRYRNALERNNKTPDEVIREDRWNIVRAALFFRKTSGSERVKILTPNQIILDGEQFDLTDSNSRIFAGALISTYIEGIEGQRRPYYLSYLPKETERRIKDLMTKISFVDFNGPPHVHPSEFYELQPIIKTLEAKGHPYPRTWGTSGYEPYYSQSTISKDRDGILYFEPGYPIEGLAEYYRVTEPDLYSKFAREVGQAEQMKEEQAHIPGLDLVAPRYSFRPESTMEQKFRQALAQYLNDGQYLRNRLEYALAIGDQVSATILKLKIDIFRDRLGLETLVGGIIKENVDLSVGNIVEVVDYEDPRGIVLKKVPTPSMKPEHLKAYVLGGMKVRVLSQPVKVVYPGLKSALDMVKVELVNPRGYEGWYAETFSTGYMPVQYLKERGND